MSISRVGVCAVLLASLPLPVHGQIIPIVNPGFETVIPRDLDSAEITNGARGTGNQVGTRASFYELPQFKELVEIPGWRTFSDDPFLPLPTGILNPDFEVEGQPFLAGYSGDNVAAVRLSAIQQTLPVMLQPDTRYTLTFLAGAGVGEPVGAVYMALVAAPDLETFAEFGAPDVVTLATETANVPEGSEGQMLPYSLEYVSPATLPEDLANRFIAISFAGSDGLPLMNYDDFQLEATPLFLPGDVNLDGVVSLADIPAFIDILSSGGFQAEADINGDGTVSLADISLFVDLLAGN